MTKKDKGAKRKRWDYVFQRERRGSSEGGNIQEIEIKGGKNRGDEGKKPPPLEPAR